ncbi:EVE domain-containing protein [Alcanivorax sp.]|uniref:EVE domain-containing protein n=1 Tax=Alcanivorax sp. TaxID=1872427 RepID=UPI0032D96156
MNIIWLLKTEPDVFSIDDLRGSKNATSGWDGVRNYQARNRLRDEMKAGDTVLIYHSSCAVPAIVGEARVTSAPYPDPTQFDPAADGYDSRSTRDHPRWYQADVQYVCHYPQPLTLKQVQHHPEFADMELVVRPRLSVQKVSERQLQLIRQMCQLVDATA